MRDNKAGTDKEKFRKLRCFLFDKFKRRSQKMTDRMADMVKVTG